VLTYLPEQGASRSTRSHRNPGNNETGVAAVNGGGEGDGGAAVTVGGGAPVDRADTASSKLA
jgi:hypothetical protein